MAYGNRDRLAFAEKGDHLFDSVSIGLNMAAYRHAKRLPSALKSGPVVLIQQRVHDEDLASLLLEQGGWVYLDLQAIAQEQTAIELGRGRQVKREEDDLRHSDRFPRDLLDRRREELGSDVFAA